MSKDFSLIIGYFIATFSSKFGPLNIRHVFIFPTYVQEVIVGFGFFLFFVLGQQLKLWLIFCC